jgi:hypothetical protein
MALVGMVIPTIFSRPTLLPLAVDSILGQGVELELVIGCPEELVPQVRRAVGDIVRVIAETPGTSLAQKINDLFDSLSPSCQYIGWLGDDDILLPGALEATANALVRDAKLAMVYGGCDYISPTGDVLFTNKSSQFASTLLSFGPQLIPQPGALWRRSAFEKVGGLSGEFNLAFDFDLFLKLKKVGKLKHIPQTLAQFRWHPDSLSVKKRWVSVSEASKVRRKHYRFPMTFLWSVWEPIVMAATYLAGKLVSKKFLTTSSKQS